MCHVPRTRPATRPSHHALPSLDLSPAAFTLTARATPDWETFGLKIAPTAEALSEDVHAWSQSVSEVLRRMRAMHERLDLEDTRKSL